MIFVDTRPFWAALGNAGDARHGTAKKPGPAKPPVVMTPTMSWARPDAANWLNRAAVVATKSSA